MIVLNEIATKLSNILNRNDLETQSITGLPDFDFIVATEGFHLDKISGKSNNFIPVFVSSLGGEYDPVPGLKKVLYSASITLYFPVRYKNEFYAMNDFLANCFVGKILNYGTISGNCLSNISVAEYGEIQDLDLDQFKVWVEQNYRKDLNITEPYMSMTFSLYLTSGSQVYWGNEVKYGIQITYNGTRYPDNADSTAFLDVRWDNYHSEIDNAPIAQQLISTDKYTKNVINTTTRSRSILVYPDDSDLWTQIFSAYNSGNTDLITDIQIKKTLRNTSWTYSSNVILTLNENIALGEPISFTITLGDKL